MDITGPMLLKLLENLHKKMGVQAAHLEWNIKVTLDLFTEDKGINPNKNLSDAVDELCKKALLADNYKSLLKEAVRLRNKLLHCDFQTALNILSRLYPSTAFESPDVWLIKGLGTEHPTTGRIDEFCKRDRGIYGNTIQFAIMGGYDLSARLFNVVEDILTMVQDARSL